MHPLELRIRNINQGENFEQLALDIFTFQYQNVPIYKEYVDQLDKATPKTIEEIPFLPIQFFKTHKILADNHHEEIVFKSSGTGGTRSSHFVSSKDLYEFAFDMGYRELIGNPEEQVIIALLPNYLEQGESSLIYMVDHLIRQTNNSSSGFCLNDPTEVLERYKIALSKNKKVVIFGVSYALLDLCESRPDLSQATIIETGGMKGRRKEMTKSELHEMLKVGLNCDQISSEYGMTELLSQGYSSADGIFHNSPSLHVLIRDINDPFSYHHDGKSGGINAIDLANLYSCSFIETQDLGKVNDEGYEVLGRIDLAEQRGCNLMIS